MPEHRYTSSWDTMLLKQSLFILIGGMLGLIPKTKTWFNGCNSFYIKLLQNTSKNKMFNWWNVSSSHAPNGRKSVTMNLIWAHWKSDRAVTLSLPNKADGSRCSKPTVSIFVNETYRKENTNEVFNFRW